MSISARLIEFCTILKQNLDRVQVLLEGEARSGVSKVEPYGFRSSVPVESRGLVLSPNGQAKDLIFMGVFTRFFNRVELVEGELELYTVHGNSIILKQDGSIAIVGSVAIQGNLTVTGNVSDANGSMAEMRSQYNSHTHGGGPAPSPTMS
jgi:phage gp45-like